MVAERSMAGLLRERAFGSGNAAALAAETRMPGTYFVAPPPTSTERRS